MSEKTVRLSIDCLREERKKIKLLCTLSEMTISDWVMGCVREKLNREAAHIPNEATIKALKESERGEGVKTYGSAEELFSDLDL